MNEHISNYCKSFIESNTSPQFAVFIKGKWGSGKTFFIKKLINELPKPEKVIYISLFSVKSSDEIDYKLFEAVHPVLSSSLPKYSKLVFRTLIKNRIPYSDIIKELSDSSQKVEVNLDDLMYDDRIIIVDDFERSSLNAGDILGYFSFLISDTNNRVLFVGNEDEVSDWDKFKAIKEKTIGAEFTLKCDLDGALQSFFNDIPFDSDEATVIDKAIRNVIDVIDCENLRIVREALYNLDLFLDCLPDNYLSIEENVISSFLLLFIHKSLGLISRENVSECLHAFFEKKMSFPVFVETKRKDKEGFWDYPLLYENHRLFSNETWTKIVFDGFYDKASLTSEFLIVYEKKLKQKESNLYKLFGWFYMDASEFKNILETVQKEFSDGYYIHPGEIIHYSSLMLQFCKQALLPFSFDEIKKRVLEVVNERISPMSKGDWDRMLSSGFYGNYGFGDLNDKEIAELLDVIKNKCIAAFDLEAKLILEECIDNLPMTIRKLCEIIRNESDYDYASVPLLSLIDVDVFHERVKALRSTDIESIVYALESRYKNFAGYFKQAYIADYHNLKKLVAHVEYDLNCVEKLFNPRAAFLFSWHSHMEKIVRFFEEKVIDNQKQ